MPCSGAVLGQLLSFCSELKRSSSVAEKLKILDSYPTLVFNVSDHVRFKVFPQLNEILKDKWRALLQLDNMYAFLYFLTPLFLENL